MRADSSCPGRARGSSPLERRPSRCSRTSVCGDPSTSSARSISSQPWRTATVLSSLPVRVTTRCRSPRLLSQCARGGTRPLPCTCQRCGPRHALVTTARIAWTGPCSRLLTKAGTTPRRRAVLAQRCRRVRMRSSVAACARRRARIGFVLPRVPPRLGRAGAPSLGSATSRSSDRVWHSARTMGARCSRRGVARRPSQPVPLRG